MDFNATIDLIIRDLEDARKIIDDLKTYPGVPLLQVELAKAKCKSAGEVISLLKTEVGSRSAAEIPQQREKEAEDVNKNSHSKKAPESFIIGDSFSHLSNKLNEQLGSWKTDDDLSDIMKNKPLTSLKEAIGINDRFLFIREIFNGNKEAYSQALSKLETINSITDARAVIMSYTGDSEENEAVNQLLNLVKRKLPSNE